MGNLDFTKDAEELERLVRGLNSWPGAYTFLQEKMLKILASYVKEKESLGTPGEVISVNKDEFVIQCGKGTDRQAHGKVSRKCSSSLEQGQ